MKTEFKARPVCLLRDDRITAHFTTCFLALVVFRYAEKIFGHKYTCNDILGGLRTMKFLKTSEGFIPAYTRTDFTDDLHEAFGFRSDYQILTKPVLIIFSIFQKNFSHSTERHNRKTPLTCFITRVKRVFAHFRCQRWDVLTYTAHSCKCSIVYHSSFCPAVTYL